MIGEGAAWFGGRVPKAPAEEVVLLAVLGEVAATTGDRRRAYSLAALIQSTKPNNPRALVISSIANYELGNVHESLGNAIHANKVSPQEQTAILQLMKCHNKLADFYSVIAAFKAITVNVQAMPEIYAQLGVAYARLDNVAHAVNAYRQALKLLYAFRHFAFPLMP